MSNSGDIRGLCRSKQSLKAPDLASIEHKISPTLRAPAQGSFGPIPFHWAPLGLAWAQSVALGRRWSALASYGRLCLPFSAGLVALLVPLTPTAAATPL